MVTLYKNDNYQFVVLISMPRYRMFTCFYAASFSVKTCFYEASNVFYREY